MNAHPDCLMRRKPILGFSLAIGLMISPLEEARSQSIVTDGDIVGDGISLQALKDSHCDHLENLHAGSALPFFCTLPADTRFVFVTSTGSTAGGNLVQWANDLITPKTPFNDGLLAADAICQHHADNSANPLPGTYKAWLSTDAVDAKDRIGDHKWVLPGAITVIADSLTDLIDCTNPTCLQNPINANETGGPAPTYTFTGTSPEGVTTAEKNCLNWTTSDNTEEYIDGETQFSSSNWTGDGNPTDCSVDDSLYCFGI